MPKKPAEPTACTYTSVKIDDEVMPLVRAAAALSGNVSAQEFLSDLANRAASQILGREPLKRRPPPPRIGGRAKK